MKLFLHLIFRISIAL